LKLLDHLLGRHKTVQPPQPTLSTARIATIIDDALAAAGLDRNSPQGGGIAAVIDDALTRAGLRNPGIAPGIAHGTAASPGAPLVRAIPEAAPPATPAAPAHGQFLSRSLACDAGTLAYKVYVPVGYDAEPAQRFPLVVMLHGCTQSPDDFAAGTRMNALADQHGVLVAYPAQSANANGSRCWNWFRPQDQVRGRGEPALIAEMAAQVGAQYRVDTARIYVAGLSAGGAMAVILGETYPDVFAAVGAHSGLPYRAAHDVGSAFAAMKGGAARNAHGGAQAPVPTIVFHGDRDTTVAAANGAAIVAQRVSATAAALDTSEHAGTASGGRSYACTRYAEPSGRSLIEDWRVQGGGHAWMGGSASGTYTDPQGPDASVEMLRFFLQHTR